MPLLEADRALIKIKRIGICGTDLHAFEGTQPFFNYPRILGHELAGEVVAGGEAFELTRGTLVTILPYFNCGSCIACRNNKPNCCTQLQVFGVHIDGGMQEVISVPIQAVVVGDGLSMDQLALVEPLAIGAHAVGRAAIQADEFVLVIGAGPIGLATMAFAKIAGARIIAMDVNEHRLQFCKDKLGITHLINAATENAVDRLAEITDNDMPTVVMDATGNLKAINDAFLYIAHGGRYVLVGLQKETICFSHPEFHKREATLMSSRNATRHDFRYVIDCIRNGQVNPTDFITHRVSFGDVKKHFESWLRPETGVVKAMVELL